MSCPTPPPANPITPAQFRLDFPEFANTTPYPDTLINFWLTVSQSLLSPIAWLDLLNYGTELFIAHQLALSAQRQAAAAVGGVPGTSVGMTTSKSVDKVSVGFDTASVAVVDAGSYNLTSYGIQFYQLAQLVGSKGFIAINQGEEYDGAYYYQGVV